MLDRFIPVIVVVCKTGGLLKRFRHGPCPFTIRIREEWNQALHLQKRGPTLDSKMSTCRSLNCWLPEFRELLPRILLLER